jgi:hypothetical protein
MIGQAEGQMSRDLKDFLWQKDFENLIENYADEKIHLHDKGKNLERLAARPYKEVPGLRIQVFAGSDPMNAQMKAQELRTLNLDSVYVTEKKGLFRVQLGNFLYRIEAEKMLDRIGHAGISNAWITETMIRIPKQESEESQDHEKISAYEMNYAIQVFVTGDPEKAVELSEHFQQVFDENVRIVNQANVWKILIGNYTKEREAREKLEEIRQAGFPDAWLTQIDD